MRLPSLAVVDAEIDFVAAAPDASRWLRSAVEAMRDRDPVDMLRDAELLVEWARARCDAIVEDLDSGVVVAG